MDITLLVKKAISGSLSEREQATLVRSVNKSLSALTLLLQKSHSTYQNATKADEVLRKIQHKKK